MPIAVSKGCIFEMMDCVQSSIVLLFGTAGFNSLHASSLRWENLFPEAEVDRRFLAQSATDHIHEKPRSLLNGNVLFSVCDRGEDGIIGLSDDCLYRIMLNGYNWAKKHSLRMMVTNGCRPLETRLHVPNNDFLKARNVRADFMERIAKQHAECLTIFVNRSQVFRARY